MQDIYVNMQGDDVNMQDIYVDKRIDYVNWFIFMST